eukprot:4047174-Pyramimonas_sp.AAC.1
MLKKLLGSPNTLTDAPRAAERLRRRPKRPTQGAQETSEETRKNIQKAYGMSGRPPPILILLLCLLLILLLILILLLFVLISK